MSTYTGNNSIKKHGSNYRLASLFFAEQQKNKIHLLYAYVRRADNVVDSDLPREQAKLQLKQLQKTFNRTATSTEKKGDTLTTNFIALCQESSIPKERVNSFFASMLDDTKKSTYATRDQLNKYIYGSAEVIGLMICQTTSTPTDGHDAAKKLGYAMQYTNFLRDIYEDYTTYGRIYLPKEELSKFDLTLEDIQAFCRGKPVNKQRKQFLKKQITYCRSLYKTAENGIKWLPPSAQLPVLLSARLYRNILKRIEDNGYDVFSKPSHTSSTQKGVVITKTLLLFGKRQFDLLRKVSRPRFRIYLLGPVLIGWAALATHWTDFLDWKFLLLFFYFTLPANLFLYGINDIYDYQTDKENPKKQGYEQLLTKDRHAFISRSATLLNLPFLALSIAFLPIEALWILALFLLLSRQYSARPLRLKAIPFLDSISNILYILPGIVAYLSAGGSNFTWAVFGAGLWAMAMHTYSAIPDREIDKKAGITTTAVLLGKQGTLLYCGLLRGIAMVLAIPTLGIVAWIAGSIYILVTLLSSTYRVLSLYKWFPLINTLIGMSIFFLLVTHLI